MLQPTTNRQLEQKKWADSLPLRGSRLHFLGLFFPPLAPLFHVAVEEKSEEGADRRDRGQTADLIPRRRDGSVHDVAGELKREPRDQPARVAHPCFARLCGTCPPGYDRQRADERLDRADC